MKKSERLFILLIILLSVFSFVEKTSAHGTGYNIIKGGIGIEAMYNEGSPMSDSDVTLFSPDNSTNPYLTGITDQKGRFIFFPETKGEWILRVDDGMGHSLTAKLDVTEKGVLSKTDGAILSYLQKITMAICVLWGLIGTGLYFKSKKDN